MVAGAILATLFGAVVMSRWMAEMPGVTLTVISIAGPAGGGKPVRVLSAPRLASRWRPSVPEGDTRLQDRGPNNRLGRVG